MERRILVLAVTLCALLQGGCWSLLYGVAVPFLYREVALPAEQIHSNLAYREDAGADPEKHRLDLYLPGPEHTGFRSIVFVHGGGWTTGDRELRVGDADIYGNVGRAFASAGIAAAIVSYRLLPTTDWRGQVADVADAAAFVQRRIAAYGGDPGAIFLGGHSAGAWLTSHAVLEPSTLPAAGFQGPVCGLIAISGSGYDLVDHETHEQGLRRYYYAERFASGPDDLTWDLAGSPIFLVRADAPPSLLMYAEGEFAPLRRQSRLFHGALVAAGATTRLRTIPREGHLRMIVALSRPDKPALPTVLDFVRGTACGAVVSAPPGPPAAPGPAPRRDGPAS